MTAKTSQTHGLGDHVLHDHTSTRGTTDGGNPASHDTAPPPTDDSRHPVTTSEQDKSTGLKETGGAAYYRRKRLAAGLPLRKPGPGARPGV